MKSQAFTFWLSRQSKSLEIIHPWHQELSHSIKNSWSLSSVNQTLVGMLKTLFYTYICTYVLLLTWLFIYFINTFWIQYLNNSGSESEIKQIQISVKNGVLSQNLHQLDLTNWSLTQFNLICINEHFKMHPN